MKINKEKRENGLIVLSLFDGMSCGRLALEKAGIKVDKYIASEIKPFAIEHTMKRYPDTISIGDVTRVHYDKATKTLYANCDKKLIATFGEKKTDLQIASKDAWTQEELDEFEAQGFKKNKSGEIVRVAYTKEEMKEFEEKGYDTILTNNPNLSGDIVEWDVSNADVVYVGDIDLLIGGSPCQNFSMANSFANAASYGLAGEKSRLFNEYYRIKNEINPTYFFLENVKMKKDSEEMLNGFMGVDGLHINSNTISIQHRDRIYWTNIKDFKNFDPKTMDEKFNNISQPTPRKLYLCKKNNTVPSVSLQDYMIRTIERVESILRKKRFDEHKLKLDEDDIKELALTPEEIKWICDKNAWVRKEVEKGRRLDKVDNKHTRNLSDEDFVKFIHEVLMESLVKKTPSRDKMWNDGKTAQFACKNITNEDKMSCLTRKQDRFPNSGLIEFGGYCRFVNRLEICKGQTVPYDFLADLTYSQIQDVCGDGWTVDVISYIFKHLKQMYDFK